MMFYLLFNDVLLTIKRKGSEEPNHYACSVSSTATLANARMSLNTSILTSYATLNPPQEKLVIVPSSEGRTVNQ